MMGKGALMDCEVILLASKNTIDVQEMKKRGRGWKKGKQDHVCEETREIQRARRTNRNKYECVWGVRTWGIQMAEMLDVP